LLISPFFPPKNAAASTRRYSFARCWAKAGHEVTVLTTVKRPDQEGFDATYDGFEVVAIPHTIPAFLERLRARDMSEYKPTNGIAERKPFWFSWLQQLRERTGIYCSDRMPDLTDFWVRPATNWIRSQQKRWDIVVSSSPPYTAHLVALRAKRWGSARFWSTDFQDPWTRHHAFSGLFPLTIAERWLEKRCLEEVDLVTTVTEGFAEGFRNRTQAPVRVLSNGYDAGVRARASSSPIFPDDRHIRLVYTGTLYAEDQNPMPLLRALAQLVVTDKEHASRFRVVVASLYEKHWLALAQQIGVGNLVEHVAGVHRLDAVRMQRDADALLLVDWEDSSAGVIPSKVFEYLQTTPPILAVGGSPDSPVGQLLRQTGRGVHLGRNVTEIMNFLVRLVGRMHDPITLVRNEDEIRTFSVEHQAMGYLQLLEQMTAAGQSVTPAAALCSSLPN
jgi:hypothetical protein